MPFFCRPEESGGLGYRETEPNIVSDDLFIPSQLAEFVKIADPQTWRAVAEVIFDLVDQNKRIDMPELMAYLKTTQPKE